MILAIMKRILPKERKKLGHLSPNDRIKRKSRSTLDPTRATAPNTVSSSYELPTTNDTGRPNKPCTTDPSSTSNVEGDFPHERVLASLLLHLTANALVTTHSERVLIQSEDGTKPAPKSTTHPYRGTSSPLNPSTPPHPPHLAHLTSPPSLNHLHTGSQTSIAPHHRTPDTPRAKPNPPQGIEHKALSQRYDAALRSTRSRRI